jgi:periplasmic divalent cation tolerance protein
MKFFLVYVTCVNVDEAGTISEALIAEKLIACANIMPVMQAICLWQGELARSDEVVLLLKTSADKFEAVRRRVRELHSYQVPAIFALPIEAIDDDYAKWAKEVMT